MAAGVAFGCLGARAEPQVGPDAFITPPHCNVEPFADGSVAQYLDDFKRTCGGAATRLQIESPRERDSDSGPGLLKAQAQRITSLRLGAVTTTLELAWSGAGESDGRLRTERAVFAAGSLLHLDRAVALRADLGKDMAGEARQRARFAGLWKPRENSLLFAEWAGNIGRTNHHAVGVRWYLIHKRVALDFGARRTPWASGSIEPRIGLLLPGLGQ